MTTRHPLVQWHPFLYPNRLTAVHIPRYTGMTLCGRRYDPETARLTIDERRHECEGQMCGRCKQIAKCALGEEEEK